MPQTTRNICTGAASCTRPATWARLSLTFDCGTLVSGAHNTALIFEDNVLFKSDSLARVNATIARIPEVGFINFAVLRPRGYVHDAKTNIYRYIRAQYLSEPVPNVWMSSYFISKSFAEKMLKYFEARRFNFNTLIIDREVSRYISMRGFNASFYVHPGVFGHMESSRDMRKVAIP